MQLGRLRPAIVRRDLHQDVLRAGLGILHEDVEVAILVEDAGVEEFILHVVACATTVGVDQIGIGIGRLRILVEMLHVRVGRRAIEVEVILLDVLAVIAFAVGEAEQALLENRVLAVPQREGKTQALLVIGDTGDAVLAPAIGTRAGVIVGEEIPGVAALAVVLAHGAPLTFAQVGSPLLPVPLAFPRLCQTLLFSRCHLSSVFPHVNVDAIWITCNMEMTICSIF